MTAKALNLKIRMRSAIKEPHKTLLSLLSVFSLLLILKSPDTAIKNTSEALELCAFTVIPSLFPFMVISELIVSSNAVRFFAPLFERPCKRLFGIGREGTAAVILGMLCGSPIGAKCASSLYRLGKIDKREYMHLLTFSNSPSSAFLISAVGAKMFQSKSFGVLLYAISLTSAVIIGIAGARLGLYKGRSNTEKFGKNDFQGDTKAKKGISLFTESVSSSAISMLYICAFVVFFSTLVGTLEAFIDALSLPTYINALLFGFFEMTGGIWAASGIPRIGAYIAAFIAGWSGLSVHFQIMSVCGKDDISFAPYITAKLCQGVLNTLLFALVCMIFGFAV